MKPHFSRSTPPLRPPTGSSPPPAPLSVSERLSLAEIKSRPERIRAKADLLRAIGQAFLCACVGTGLLIAVFRYPVESLAVGGIGGVITALIAIVLRKQPTVR